MRFTRCSPPHPQLLSPVLGGEGRKCERLRRLGLVGLLLLLAGGCGGGDGPRPKLAPVRGRVVFKNQPVSAAEIYFLPDASRGNQGTMASAALQLDGSFTMLTPPDREGILPGAYKVTLGLGRRPEKELVKYRSIQHTPLAFTVPDDGLPNLVIELE
jgi:hypothetical protein